MQKIPESTYKSIEEVTWNISIILPLNAGVRKTYGVLNKQLKELSDCAIKRILITEETGYECILQIVLNKEFININGKEKTKSFLNNFIQEYLNLNNLKLSSFKTNFVEEIKSIQDFKYNKTDENKNIEEYSLNNIFEKRLKLL